MGSGRLPGQAGSLVTPFPFDESTRQSLTHATQGATAPDRGLAQASVECAITVPAYEAAAAARDLALVRRTFGLHHVDGP
jgi:hypothetical protein